MRASSARTVLDELRSRQQLAIQDALHVETVMSTTNKRAHLLNLSFSFILRAEGSDSSCSRQGILQGLLSLHQMPQAASRRVF
jgi:hypothetical protein